MDQLTAITTAFIDVVASLIISLGFFAYPATPVEPTSIPPVPTTVTPRPATTSSAGTSFAVAHDATPEEAGRVIAEAAASSRVIDAGVVPLAPVIAQVYEADPGSPLFATLALPKLKDIQEDYAIYLWNGSKYEFYKNLAPLAVMTFPDEGVDRFKIGIDPKLGLTCDGVFFKQITFNSSGAFKGKSYRLTASLDHPVCEE